MIYGKMQFIASFAFVSEVRSTKRRKRKSSWLSFFGRVFMSLDHQIEGKMEQILDSMVLKFLLAILSLLGAWSFFKDLIPPAIGWIVSKNEKRKLGKHTKEAVSILQSFSNLSRLRDTRTLIIFCFTNISITLAIFAASAFNFLLSQLGGPVDVFGKLPGIVLAVAAMFNLGVFANTLDKVRRFENVEEESAKRLEQLMKVEGVGDAIQEWANKNLQVSSKK